MYQVKENGLGKKVCNADGVTILSTDLSQYKLKRLFKINCEFIEYVEQQQGKAPEQGQSTNNASTSSSGKQSEENTTDNSSSRSTGRKQRSGKGAKKS
jgi:hypothetical protein